MLDLTLARPDVNDLKLQDFKIVLRALKCFHEIFPCKVNLSLPQSWTTFQIEKLNNIVMLAHIFINYWWTVPGMQAGLALLSRCLGNATLNRFKTGSSFLPEALFSTLNASNDSHA